MRFSFATADRITERTTSKTFGQLFEQKLGVSCAEEVKIINHKVKERNAKEMVVEEDTIIE